MKGGGGDCRAAESREGHCKLGFLGVGILSAKSAISCGAYLANRLIYPNG